MTKKYSVTAPPHILSHDSTAKRMWKSLAALLPLFVILLTGKFLPTLRVSGLVLAGAALAEAVGTLLLKRKPKLLDGSTMLLVFLMIAILPADFPAPGIFLASAAALFLGKIFYGNSGAWFHPALLAYALLAASFPEIARAPESWMFSFWNPFTNAWTLLVSLALIAGGILLLIQRIVFWEMPLIYLTLVFIPCLLMRIHTTLSLPLVLICGFWMLADPVSTPATRRGCLCFAGAAALLTLVCDLLSAPGAPVFAVLTLNILTPWIDERVLPRGIEVSK